MCAQSVVSQSFVINQCLARASELVLVSDSARLDTEILLAHVLGKPRSHLYAWPEKNLASKEYQQFCELFERRLSGEPIAYLTGEKEFWSLPFVVNEHTLIPRPATETLVEQALQCLSSVKQPLPLSVLDLGTGTGAVALAIAHERPLCELVAVDQSAEALAVACANSQRLALNNVSFLQSDWYEQLNQLFSVIVSNPPYIDDSDPHLSEGDVCFEPRSALVAESQGLADLVLIINQAPGYLLDSGWLLLEHGYQQASAVRSAMAERGFVNVSTVNDNDGHPRVSLGQKVSEKRGGQANG